MLKGRVDTCLLMATPYSFFTLLRRAFLKGVRSEHAVKHINGILKRIVNCNPRLCSVGWWERTHARTERKKKNSKFKENQLVDLLRL